MNSRELFTLAVVISKPSACSSTAPYFEAASEPGFPETVRLLEEPQAAFYCWLELHQLVYSSYKSSFNGPALAIPIEYGIFPPMTFFHS
jgi:hypothetical protein